VARPLWLRLFGPNGPATIAEFREALQNATFGEGVGGGHFLANIRAILNLPTPDRPVAPDRPRDVLVRELPLAGLAIDAPQDPGMAPPAPALALALEGAGAIDTGAANLAGADAERNATIYLNGVVSNPLMAGGVSSSARLDLTSPYALLGDPQSGLVIDTRTKTLMQGGPGDHPELGAGKNDVVELNGDFSAGFDVAVPGFVEQVVARRGSDYNLIADDNSVAAGGSLIVNAMPLGDANRMIFDGTAESDGRFTFFGGAGDDMFLGGAGNDLIWGLDGADVLSGGGGSDTFAYHDTAQSSGAAHDVLADFNAAVDKIDLDVAVAGFDAAIATGSLSADSFDADLGAALAGLGAGRAVFYAPDAGDLAGTVFLVVDANGIAGYQEGEDYVFALAGASLADLSGHTGFFI
jgi:Ca2+-binding RTX toxin-like protein